MRRYIIKNTLSTELDNFPEPHFYCLIMSLAWIIRILSADRKLPDSCSMLQLFFSILQLLNYSCTVYFALDFSHVVIYVGLSSMHIHSLYCRHPCFQCKVTFSASFKLHLRTILFPACTIGMISCRYSSGRYFSTSEYSD